MSSQSKKRLLQDFEDHCRRIAEHTSVSANETEAEKSARIKKARNDYNFFFEYYFPHYATSKSAKFHIEAANEIKKYPVIRAILKWFRGAAKSSHTNTGIPMWLKIQEPRQINVMVLCGKSEDDAKTLLSDLQAEFLTNGRYIADFGDQFNEGTWEAGRFSTKDGCTFYAKGRGQSPRGLKKRQHRPDVIILDDIDDDELVLNESRVDKVVKWAVEALFGTMDMGRGRFIIVGNLIHQKSVLAKIETHFKRVEAEQKAIAEQTGAKFQQHIYISTVPIKDEKGNITWPEKYDDQRVTEAILFYGPRGHQRELFHNPITGGTIFKEEWFNFKKLPKPNEYRHLVAYLDGGFKKTNTSDSKALILAGLWKGEIHILKVYVGQASVEEMIGWHYDLDKWLKARQATCVWHMEEVFLLDLLYKDFKAAKSTYGYMIPIQGDKRKKPDKDLRIEGTAGYFERGNIFFNEDEKASHHMNRLLEQYYSFEPPKKTQKDGPDAVEGAIYKLNQKVMTSEPMIIGQRRGNKFKF